MNNQPNLAKTIHISYIDNLILESKKFLHELALQEKNIIIRLSGSTKLVQLYQEEDFVFLVPDCNENETLLYGNWEEALHAMERRFKTNEEGLL